MKKLVKTWFFRLYWLLDIVFLLLLSLLTKGQKYNSIFSILIVVSLVYNAIYLFRWWKGRQYASINMKNYRIQGFSGDIGLGKTSIILNLANMRAKGRPIVSNIPFKLNGEFNYILTKDAVTMKTQLPQQTFVVFDELSLYFNNLDQTKKRLEVAGFEGFLQMLRQNFDGNCYCSSVVMDRVLAVLQEKFGLENMLLEQRSVKTGFVVPFVYWVARKFNSKLPRIYWGYRRWKVQTFLKINQKNYIYDLSNDVANQKTNKFVNLYYFYAFNDGSVEYNDRFCSKLYSTLPIEPLKRFTSLDFDGDVVCESGFDSIAQLYDIDLENYIKCSKGVVPDNPRKGVVGENTDTSS